MRGARAGAAVVMAVAVATGAAGCGGGGSDLVVTGTAPAKVYAGPLQVAAKAVAAVDEDSPAAMRARAGAAGQALECDGDLYSGGGADRWSEGDGGSTPARGLKAYFDMEQPGLPEYGYRAERVEPDRVLYSFDVDGRTRIAVVVAKDQPGRPGWGPETSASCDPAELPASFTDQQGYEIWTGVDGRRVPVSTVSSSAGSAHCDWQRAHFLDLGAGPDRLVYARDPHGVLPASMLTSRYDGEAALPAGARDTGYRLGDWALWVTADTSTAYVRTSDGVEAWPEVPQGMGCK